MKILFTGGGTGGHFYPLIAVAEEVNSIVDAEKIVDAKLYYMSDSPYDKAALFENGIAFESIVAGKLRTYADHRNVTDMIKTAVGCVIALFKLFAIYPDVVFAKGGYGSFPALFAARILRIPVVIHESDSVPGRVNVWAAKFAKRIAISYDEAVEYFPKDKTALTGQPIRREIEKKAMEGAFEFLKLDPSMPVLFVLGGSLGSVAINDTLIDILPELLKRYQVIHQVGPTNVEAVKERISVVLENHPNLDRYKVYGYMNPLAIKMAAGAATLIISRAGSTIFEIASWGVPSIIIPISKVISRDQESNAFNYDRAGACEVIESDNLSRTILQETIDKLIGNPLRLEKMAAAAKAFAKPGAAREIARELVDIALSHEQ